MHRSRRLTAAVALAAALIVGAPGCSTIFGSGDVLVRLENASPVAFDRATLYTSEGPRTTLDLGPGQATPYVSVATAYRIATTQVEIDADTLRLQVIDFVGEEPLSAGRYTYVISVVDLGAASPSLTQVIRQDP
jgi:hypothetical protein